MTPTIAIGSDHAGFYMKEHCRDTLSWGQHLLHNVGCYNSDKCDYPDFAHQVAKSVQDGLVRWGILFCGSANGVAITANKYPKVLAALCWNAEVAELARKHNNANVLCIPARFVTMPEAEKIIKTFLSTGFEGGRHEVRVRKIVNDLEILSTKQK